MGRIVIGTCGFQKSRKLHYNNLDGVEVQATFYDPRNTVLLEKWRKEAPTGFVFTMKAWMLITHKYNKKLWRRLKKEPPGDRGRYGFFRDTEEVWWAWEKTLEAADAIDAEVIVLQSPASFAPTEENLNALRGFLGKAERRGRALAWEPRGEWWTRLDLLGQIAAQHDVMIVGDPLKERTPIGGVAYVRLHGMGGEVNYRCKYAKDDLARLHSWAMKEGKTSRAVYIMFNNVYAYEDAVTLKTLIAGNQI